MTVEEMVAKVMAELNTPAGRARIEESNRRCDAFAEELKKTRPTKETWDWTPTI